MFEMIVSDLTYVHVDKVWTTFASNGLTILRLSNTSVHTYKDVNLVSKASSKFKRKLNDIRYFHILRLKESKNIKLLTRY